MNEDSRTEEEIFALDEPDPTWISVTNLQCRIRELFESQPTHRAAAMALAEIGAALEADYVVCHARFGVQPLTEEWSTPEFELSEELRNQVNSLMASAADSEEPRCVRLSGRLGDIGVTAANLYDQTAEQVGGVGLVFRDAGRSHAYEMLVHLESLVGFLAVLLWDTTSRSANTSNRPATDLTQSPLRILLELVADLTTRYEVDQVAVGVVDGQRVRVALVNNDMDLRRSNPGVRAIQGAMAECLDIGEAISFHEDPGAPQYRLHAAWRNQRQGGTVATVPLLVDGGVVAIVAVASTQSGSPDASMLRSIQAELQGFSSLLPTARLATRSLFQHGLDSLREAWTRVGGFRTRTLLAVSALLAAAAWLAFGTLPYRVTVPCVVKAMDRRVVSCPRDGVLAEIYVRPGEQVREGQLLAELDSHDDQLTKSELEAEVVSIEAQIDIALGTYDSGKLRVLHAQRDGLLSRVATISRRIELAQIRAPRDGVILAGELREQLGARLTMGVAMFELARYDGTGVEMKVPESAVLAARDAQMQEFIPAAAPDRRHRLSEFWIAPASTAREGKNVFLAEATLAETVVGLPPGVEGFVVLDVGSRPAYWVLTHRIGDWLRLNLWL